MNKAEAKARPFKQYNNLKQMVLALAATVEAKDVYTINHSQHVAAVSGIIAKKLGLSKKGIEEVHCAALLHDIGKIGVPDYILQKPEKLSPAEFEEIKPHPEIGYRILQIAGEIFASIAPMVRDHHERWDGKGYPRGLKGEQISLGAAIIAIADAFDAMISNRPYRDGWVETKALQEIKLGSGKQFHPAVTAAFIENYEEINETAQSKLIRETAPVDRTIIDITSLALGKTHQELKEIRPFDYRVRYKGILEAINDIVLVLSDKWEIIDWNRKAEEIYGYLGEELNGMPIKKLRSFQASSKLKIDLNKVMHLGSVIYETEHCTKGGKLFSVEISARTFIQAGQTYCLAIIRDISERKQWEQELRQRERNYRLLFTGIRDSVIVHDLDLNILEANEAVCQKLGYTREELFSMNLAEIDSETMISLAPGRLEKLKEKGKLLFKGEHTAKTGEIIPAEINATLIDYEGTPAVLSLHRDLRESMAIERLTNQLLKSLPFAAYIITRDYKIIAANEVTPNAENVLGNKCHRAIFDRDVICPFCKGQKTLAIDRMQHEQVTFSEIEYQGYWVPINKELYLHYFVPISN